MSIFVRHQGRLEHLLDFTVEVPCPECSAFAHLSPIGIPRVELTARLRPDELGVSYACDACKAPVFLRYPVKSITGSRVEVSDLYNSAKPGRPKLDLGAGAEPVQALFEEAWQCFEARCFHAFVLLCRQTITLTAQLLNQRGYDNGQLRLFNTFRDAASLADLDNATFVRFKQWMFDDQALRWQNHAEGSHQGIGNDRAPQLDAHSELSDINEDDAWLLLELIKDVLYETFTRRAHLKQVLQSRQPQAVKPNAKESPNQSEETVRLTPTHWSSSTELASA